MSLIDLFLHFSSILATFMIAYILGFLRGRSIYKSKLEQVMKKRQINKEAALKAIDDMNMIVDEYEEFLEALASALLQNNIDQEDSKAFEKAKKIIQDLRSILSDARYYTLHPEELTNEINSFKPL